MTPAVAVRHVTKRYGKTVAVSDLSVDAAYGEIFAFLGSNGAGKSTTLRAIVGLTPPTSGRILIDGGPLIPKTFERVAYVPDASACYGWLTIEDHLTMTQGQFKRYERSRALDLVERFHLNPAKRVKSLSSGQSTALSLVLAFCVRPDIVILDEPMNGLDPGAQRTALDLMVAAAADGAAIVMSSHHVPQVERVADRVAILHQGSLVECGTVDDLVARHAVVEAVTGAERLVQRYPATSVDAESLIAGVEAEGGSARLVEFTLEEICLRETSDAARS
jgi:ABC-2 type transport system ATP-binding protein